MPALTPPATPAAVSNSVKTKKGELRSVKRPHTVGSIVGKGSLCLQSPLLWRGGTVCSYWNFDDIHNIDNIESRLAVVPGHLFWVLPVCIVITAISATSFVPPVHRQTSTTPRIAGAQSVGSACRGSASAGTASGLSCDCGSDGPGLHEGVQISGGLQRAWKMQRAGWVVHLRRGMDRHRLRG